MNLKRCTVVRKRKVIDSQLLKHWCYISVVRHVMVGREIATFVLIRHEIGFRTHCCYWGSLLLLVLLCIPQKSIKYKFYNFTIFNDYKILQHFSIRVSGCSSKNLWLQNFTILFFQSLKIKPFELHFILWEI